MTEALALLLQELKGRSRPLGPEKPHGHVSRPAQSGKWFVPLIPLLRKAFPPLSISPAGGNTSLPLLLLVERVTPVRTEAFLAVPWRPLLIKPEARAWAPPVPGALRLADLQ